MVKIQDTARRFHILADPIRLRILILLQDQERCVGDLCKLLGLSQPKVSYHLKLMLDAGIISRRTEGTWSYYRVVTDLRDWVQNECDRLLGESS